MKMFKQLSITFLKALAAGAAISLGGFLYCLMVFAIPNAVVGKLLGSILFSVGLFLVCSLNLSLYTGKIGLIYEKKQEKIYYISLPIILIGNLAAALGVGLLLHLILKDTEFMTVVNSVAASRLSLDNFDSYLLLCLNSFLCGLCVYLAVKLFALNRMKPLGIFMLVFFVFLFVFSGFQHCIANMFYFGLAKSFQIEMLFNLLLCILFNSFGPIVGVTMFRLIEKKK